MGRALIDLAVALQTGLDLSLFTGDEWENLDEQTGSIEGWSGGLQLADCEIVIPDLGSYTRDGLHIAAELDFDIVTPANGMKFAIGTKQVASGHRLGVGIERDSGAWRVENMFAAFGATATQALSAEPGLDGRAVFDSSGSSDSGSGFTDTIARYGEIGGARAPQSLVNGATSFRLNDSDSQLWLYAEQSTGEWTITVKKLWLYHRHA